MNKLPKEKAKELFNQYHNLIQDIGGDLGHEILVSILAKQSCLIAVDEIIKATTPLASTYFWKEVEQEINNL
jgi:MinD-like ATPase involved in chromosome partitioning or flagellar assembly